MSKNSLRKELLASRRKIPLTTRLDMSGRIVTHVVAWLARQSKIKSVFLYAAWGSEIDVLPVASAPNLAGLSFALPDAACDGTMRFRLWKNGDALVPGLFDINVPLPSASAVDASPQRLAHTLVLVPAVAVDKSGGRLGYGKGFYDRWLAAHPGVVTCGVVAEDFFLEKIPSENHDHPLNWVVTEHGFTALKA
jgi:5-formyltetrahydrofolate cyclo-ligase